MSEKNIKKSFSKVKADVSLLSTKILSMESKLDRILTIINEKESKNEEIKAFKVPFTRICANSTGNKGVQSINQSLNNHSTVNHSLSDQSLNIQSLRKDIESRFVTLTNKEFLVFLTVYQLEEDLERGITYYDLSSKIGLTAGCIRGYVSAILRKGLPLIKRKINNRTITLHIESEFRKLDAKETLTTLFYHNDPNQKRLISRD
ncbi:hypothetical protein HOA59_01505 [archaeon]|jgi:hypothetical protein|nr:hypothetical protein [archaeon]MBT6824091.1 hypothetical protein [archaeon]MBT7107064.1 hypothetical protein [archaeon]MBT7297676.1 hypothetical protein [archaeon]